MMRLWPVNSPIYDPGEDHPQAELLSGVLESACIPQQSIHLEPYSEGWKILVDSAIETGKVEVFIPRNPNEPSKIVSDSRIASKSLPFDQLFSRGYYPQAAVVAEKELQAARESVAANHVANDDSSAPIELHRDLRVLVESLHHVAIACIRTGNNERAESTLSEAIPICESQPHEYAEILTRLLHDLAYTRSLFRSTDEESTIEICREMTQARARAEQLVGREHLETARIMTSQARMLISEFSYSEADQLLLEALRIRTERLGAGHRDVSETLLEISRLNAYQENDDLAEELFLEVIEMREVQCGPHHPDVAEALFHYSDFLMYNRHDGIKAGPVLRRALAIWKETSGLDHPLVTQETGFIHKVLTFDDENSRE